MRHLLWMWLLLAVAMPAAAQDKEPIDPPEEKPPTASKADKSYAMGINIGRSIAGDELDIDMEEVIRGLTDGLDGKKSRLSDKQLSNAMIALQVEVRNRAMAKAKKQGEEAKEAGDAFLAANKKKEGVITLPSGLQYKVLRAGKGKSPKKTDTVNTHYHGTLIDGTVFDSSVERKQPISFRVDGVIAGWTEALQKMKVGDKWQLVIPPKLAYGERGTPDGAIGPNNVLVFEVELLDIEDAPEKEPAPEK
jgi:FKBP-type peptidyl-prolyl cis-trans isomerase FklB